MKTALLTTAALASLVALSACQDDADVASYNLSKAADNFEVSRRTVFLNGITDQYILEVEGLCSISDQGNQVELTCKTGPSEYKKHFLGLSDNVTYFSEQVGSVSADPYRYRVTFKPTTIIPDIDLRTPITGRTAEQ